MDNIIDPKINFDQFGICSHCMRYDELLPTKKLEGKEGEKELKKIISKIRKSGKGKQYDCLIGISGGVDSSYLAYLVKKYGLRPLAIHLDNGWDSDLAVTNIKNLLDKLKIDLITKVLNWEEFKDLQIAFLKSSTSDGEIPTDHAIFATLWKTAAKYKIKYIISGLNYATESTRIPDWSYGHYDWTYIKNVHQKYGTKKLKTFPRISLFYLAYVTFILKIKSISMLNYIDYDKESAIEKLKSELDWSPYEGKHHESIYTRFYQGYYLPKKFNIDKRYAHFSDLINSKQMTKSQALDDIKKPTYSEEKQLEDLNYILKKLSFTKKEYEIILKSPNKSYRDYKNISKYFKLIKIFVDFLRSKNLYPK